MRPRIGRIIGRAVAVVIVIAVVIGGWLGYQRWHNRPIVPPAATPVASTPTPPAQSADQLVKDLAQTVQNLHGEVGNMQTEMGKLIDGQKKLTSDVTALQQKQVPTAAVVAAPPVPETKPAPVTPKKTVAGPKPPPHKVVPPRASGLPVELRPRLSRQAQVGLGINPDSPQAEEIVRRAVMNGSIFH